MGGKSAKMNGPEKPLQTSRRKAVARLGRYAKPYRWILVGASLGLLVSSLLGLINLLLLKPAVEVLSGETANERVITQEIVYPDGKAVRLTLRDDGRPPDKKAGDGLYSAYLTEKPDAPPRVIVVESPKTWKKGKKTTVATPPLGKLIAVGPLERSWERIARPAVSQFAKANERIRQLARKDRTKALWLIAVLLLAIATVKSLIEFFCQYLLARGCYGLVADLREDLFRKIISQDYLFFIRHSTGYLESRIQSDLSSIRLTAERLLRNGFQAPFQLLFLTVLLLGLNFRLTLIALAVALATLVPLMLLGKVVRRIAAKTKRAADKLTALLEESLRNFPIIKYFQSEGAELEKFSERNRLLLRYYLKNRLAQFASAPLTQFATALSRSAILVAGGYLVFAGRMDFPTLVVYLVALTRFYGPTRALSRAATTWPAMRVSAERIAEILDLQPRVGETADALPLEKVREKIEFRNVSFAYENQEAVRDISFAVPVGRTVALVGPSGAGKTTLVCLLTRLFDPTSGAIEIDGTDIRRFKLADLRRVISTVTQETVLFNDTVARNIAYPDREPDIERVIEAARAANAHDFIVALDGGAGYNTVIGQAGLQLSGGQRQRLAIARAFYRDPQVLVFDEATSSLDEASQALVQEAVENLFRGRTVFIIAHRLSTVRKADEILVLNRGRLIERGTHEELLRRDGFYASLYKISQGGEILDLDAVEGSVP